MNARTRTQAVESLASEEVDITTGEIFPDSKPAVVDINAKNRTGILASGLKFKKIRSVTVPVIKMMPGKPVYLRFEGKMEISKQVNQKKVGDEPMKPATILHCVNLQNDSECILIVGAMLKSVIDEAYPNATYVGKNFELMNHGKLGDRKYNAYSLNEVEISEE